MLLETLLHNSRPPHEITRIFVRGDVTFFLLHGESFCTAAGHVYHSSSSMYDAPPLHIWAREAHAPDADARRDQMMRDAEMEAVLWDKHRHHLYAKLLPHAVQILVDHGVDRMMDFIEHHFDVHPGKGAMMIMKKMEG